MTGTRVVSPKVLMDQQIDGGFAEGDVVGGSSSRRSRGASTAKGARCGEVELHDGLPRLDEVVFHGERRSAQRTAESYRRWHCGRAARPDHARQHLPDIFAAT